MKKKILILGKYSFLSKSIVKALDKTNINYSVVQIKTTEKNPLSLESLEKIILNFQSNIIINCCAIVGTKQCYEQQNLSMEVNGFLPLKLGSICKKHNIKLYHISTEAVFPSLDKVSKFDEHSNPEPQTMYGKTKLVGEKILLLNDLNTVIRLPRIFNSLEQIFGTLYKRINSNLSINVAKDNIMTPVHVDLVAEKIIDIINRDNLLEKIIHISSNEVISFYDLMIMLSDKNLHNLINPVENTFFNNSYGEISLINLGLMSREENTISLNNSRNQFKKGEKNE